MLPVPKIKPIDVAFGSAHHITLMKDIPEQFKSWNDPHNQIIAHWFFKGLTTEQINKLQPRKGVNSKDAITAIFAILKSFEPKHEHKMAACAFLLHEWFDIGEEKP